MARHATRFAGRRRRNNGRAGAARRGALSLSLCVSRGDREGERSGGVRSRSRRLETHSHACRALPPPPPHRIVGSHPSRPSPPLAPPGSNPRTRRPKGGGHVETLSFDSPRTTPIVSLSLCLSLFPSSVLLLLSLVVVVVGPHAPQSNATRATANRFPFPEAIGRLPPNNRPPPLTHPSRARHRGGGPRSRGARARAQKTKLGAGRGDVWGDSGAEAASRLSEGEGEGGSVALPPPAPPPCKPFSSFSSSNFEFQFKNPTSFPVKVGTHRERERERERADPVPVA